LTEEKSESDPQLMDYVNDFADAEREVDGLEDDIKMSQDMLDDGEEEQVK